MGLRAFFMIPVHSASRGRWIGRCSARRGNHRRRRTGPEHLPGVCHGRRSSWAWKLVGDGGYTSLHPIIASRHVSMWEDSWRFFKDCPMDTACASLPRSPCSASVVQVRCLGSAARGCSSRPMRIRRGSCYHPCRMASYVVIRFIPYSSEIRFRGGLCLEHWAL